MGSLISNKNNKDNLKKVFKKIKLHKIANLCWAVIRTVLIVGLSFMILYPVLIKLSASFKSWNDFYDPTVIFIPKQFTLNNFLLVFKTINYPITFLSTVGITMLVSALQISSCVLVSYGIARFKFPGRGLIFSMVLFTLIVPPQTILMPLYLRFKFFNLFELFKFGGTLSGISLIDTLWPFILLSATAMAFKNGLYIYLLRQYFKNMPKTLEEAAYIDGCNKFKTFYTIMLPGALPMLITVFLFSFVWQWNDYFYSAVLAPKLPVLSSVMMNISFGSLGQTMSNLLSSTLSSPKFILLITPLVILYLFTQRFFTESIEKSGIVG